MDCDEEYLKATIATAQKISRHFVENCGFEGVNVLNASGVSAQQSVFHLHMHVIPRKAGDGIDIWALKDKKELDLRDLQEVENLIKDFVDKIFLLCNNIQVIKPIRERRR